VSRKAAITKQAKSPVRRSIAFLIPLPLPSPIKDDIEAMVFIRERKKQDPYQGCFGAENIT
jgi:hypothetical protein